MALPLSSVDHDYLRILRAAAVQPPLRPRVPLWAGEAVIGSVEPEFLSQIVLPPLLDGREQLSKEERSGIVGWHVQGEVTAGLNRLAAVLHAMGLAGAWRDEQLAVPDAHGQVVGTVERAAVRPLGIVTRAVHLVGLATDGRFWVQQRAFDKPNDPGLWDTLVGGMVAGTDTVATALVRETWEEAGLHVADLQAVRHGGPLRTCRPARDGGGAGYVVEDIDWYRCIVPDSLAPVNRDGEVACFALMDAHELLQKMRDGQFTLEAALIQSALLA